MADHRVNDLSYGHLGEASYDPDEQQWRFSRSDNLVAFIRPLQPLHECLPAALAPPSSDSKRTSQTWNAQNQRLVKIAPEVGPASGILSLLNRDAKRPVVDSSPSTLMGVGFAQDKEYQSATKKIQIVAVVSGEAGNLLRLIKPRVDGLGWEGHNGIKLRVLDLASLEECFWLGEGSPIKQIIFGVDTEGLTSWLAVRRAESTTLFRPFFGPLLLPSTLPRDFRKLHPPSRLFPNPLFTLKGEATGGRPHADVSFNPWYVRQFAIVDQEGYWTIWDIEGQNRKRTTLDINPGKSGHVHEGRLPKLDFKFDRTADGWGRVLWAGSVSTLIVCERRSIAVFSLKGQPKRLSCPDIIGLQSTDWILDVQRSKIRLDEIFVLTTTHIFWIQVNAAVNDSMDDNENVGAKILLSCRHFRDREDGSLRLEVLLEDDVCIVFIYSSHNDLVQTYQFLVPPEGVKTAMCSSSSFTVTRNSPQIHCGGAMQTLCMVPTMFIQNPVIPYSGPAKEYIDRGVRFYQLFALNRHLSLSCMLCATMLPPSKTLLKVVHTAQDVQLPTTRSGKGLNVMSSAVVFEDQFIVPDELDDDDSTNRLESSRKNISDSQADNLALTINACSLFSMAFGTKNSAKSSIRHLESQNISHYIENILHEIEKRKTHGPQGLTPLLVLAEYVPFSEDIDDVSSILKEVVNALSTSKSDEEHMKTAVKFIRPFSLDRDSSQSLDYDPPTVSTIYDRLVDLWVSCLPQDTPGSTRLAKERLVRNIATELYLSSATLAIRDRSISMPESWKPPEPVSMVLPVRGKDDLRSTQGQSSGKSASEVSLGSVNSDLGLQTPDPTPSISSRTRETSTIDGEPKEDDAIARLRAYALSVRSQPPLSATRSAILAQWPANPGADPSKYVWTDIRKKAGDYKDLDSDEEDGYSRQKENERRKRRKERFLERQKMDTIETTSQPTTLTSGSPPGLWQHTISSQPSTAGMPMTQPDRGKFGSRLGLKSSKKRRKGGF